MSMQLAGFVFTGNPVFEKLSKLIYLWLRFPAPGSQFLSILPL